jgi:hypothetical protein
MKTFQEFLLEKEGTYTKKEVDDLEKFANRLLNKFNLDIEFYRHFFQRLNDPRNDPAIKISELQQLFKKIVKDKGEQIKSIKTDEDGLGEAVLVDLAKDLNLPFTIELKDKNEFKIEFKTIMRKKNFFTLDDKVVYENLIS